MSISNTRCSYIVASRWYNSDAMGPYYDTVSLAEAQLRNHKLDIVISACVVEH